MGCKYPGLISAVVPFGLAAIAWRSPRAVLGFSLGLAVAIGPWLAKNVIDHGNPVYPLGWNVLGGGPWSAAHEAQWSAAHGPRPPSWPAFTDALLEIAGRSDWQSVLFVALAPLALVRPRSRKLSLVLWAYVSYIFATWWLFTHRLDRFWLPLLPPLAILAGIGADWSRSRAWTAILAFVMTVATLTNFAYGSSALTAFNEWTGDLEFLRKDVPLRLNPWLAGLDATLPPGARPLLIGQAAVFHMNHEPVYNTVFNDDIFEALARDRTPGEVGRALADRGITHIYVDWFEIGRHRKPGGYGYTPFVSKDAFERLREAGVLEPMPLAGPIDESRPSPDLFRVVPPR